MFDINRIDECSPVNNYREYQKETIARIIESFNEGYKYVMAEAPTGSGKSVIGVTLAQMAESAYYLTPQKILQTQIMGEFGDTGKYKIKSPIIDLKGRNAYPCNFYNRILADQNATLSQEKTEKYKRHQLTSPGCDLGECKREGQSKLEYCMGHCPYFNRLWRAQNAKICLMNYHSFLFQTAITHKFEKRSFMCLDEAHGQEDLLLKFVELKLSDRNFGTMGIKFPKKESPKEYLEYFQSIGLEDIIQEKIKIARALNPKEEDEWLQVLLKYSILLNTNPELWISVWEEVSSGAQRTVTLKPIFVDEFANKYIFNMADKVLMMSATLLSKKVICESLGIPQDEAKFLRMPSTFPAENRPIYFQPVGSMSYNNKATTLPKLIERVNKICKEHKDERGIIHTHTFEIANALYERCDKEVKQRFLYQKGFEFDGNREALISKHQASTNTIILAPAMHEGLDLKDDQGRFQIICKVPYPSKGDPQIAARMELSPGFYDWKTALKIVQSYGRIIRHKDDYGVTYILDDDFRMFYNRTKKMLPIWFTEAIKWID